MKRIQILTRGLLGALFALGTLAASPVTQAQTVSVNGTLTNCTAGSTTMQVDGSGNITINCTPSGSAVFTCSASASPSSIQSGSSTTSTLSVGTCSNGQPATYTWAPVPSGFTITGGSVSSSSITVTAPTGLTSSIPYPFSVSVAPVTGTTWVGSPTLTVTAAAASGGGGSGGGGTCAAKANFGGYFSTDTPAILSGSSVSYLLPAYTVFNKSIQIQGVNNGNDAATNATWGVEFAISSCGDFNPAQAACVAYGAPLNGAITLNAQSGAAASAGNCTMIYGVQYYLNVRYMNRDGVTNMCPAGKKCSFIINFHSNSTQLATP